MKKIFVVETRYSQDDDLAFDSAFTSKKKALAAGQQFSRHMYRTVVTERLPNVPTRNRLKVLMDYTNQAANEGMAPPAK